MHLSYFPYFLLFVVAYLIAVAVSCSIQRNSLKLAEEKTFLGSFVCFVCL